jgi:hypothetical protein
VDFENISSMKGQIVIRSCQRGVRITVVTVVSAVNVDRQGIKG